MPLLATKFYVPTRRSNQISRPHLIKRLNAGLDRKLTLVSASAGFGKTTLVSEWVTSAGRPVAWLSLERADSDFSRFFTYFIAAIQSIDPTIGAKVVDLLNAPDYPPVESVLTLLLNDLLTLKDPLILVLDDYHLIEAEPIDRALTFLLGHLPPEIHLVIVTREDPKVPLPQLRAKGALNEIRTHDLRFLSSEISHFLNESLSLGLNAGSITLLEERTEGWVTGLQLAAISLQGTREPDDAWFSGRHPFVFDYLIEEVVQQQPEEIQLFLTGTSILDRFCGSLAEAVIPQLFPSGQEIIEILVRSNLLIVPLDNRREWYRYHHLFAEALQSRLAALEPDHFRDFHQRASLWYETHRFSADAIEHALAAHQFSRAADLIEQDWLTNSGTYFRSPAWLGWVKRLPDQLARSRATLTIGLIWDELFSGQLVSAVERMHEADRLLKESGMVGDNLDSQRALLSLARAFGAQARGAYSETINSIHQVLDQKSNEHYYLIGVPESLLGLAYWGQGALQAAYEQTSAAFTSLCLSGNFLFANSVAFVRVTIRAEQGYLYDAIRICQERLTDLDKKGMVELPGTAELHLVLSLLYREQGDLESARLHLKKGEALGDKVALPEWPYHLYRTKARFLEDQDEFEAALDLLEKADALYQPGPVPDVRPVATAKVRIWLRQGRREDAWRWVGRRRLVLGDEIDYLSEYDYLTYVRLLIATHDDRPLEKRAELALAYLQKLHESAKNGNRVRTLVEISILQALALHKLGNRPGGMERVREGITQAAPHAFVRIFVDEGETLARLLAEEEANGLEAHYCAKLLSYFETESLSTPLIEPLSRRELEVLQLIANGLSNQEISEQLFVALSTVKGHNQRIFGKLQVQRRTEAVARARELGLL